jgi:soluble lytic murein transglycosylase-like protein
MKKKRNALCVLILGAFGFLTAESRFKGTEQTIEVVPVVNAASTLEPVKSEVVEGSFTSKVVPARTVRESECGVELKEDYSNIVVPLSKKHGLDWRLVTAIMAAESSFDPCALSPKGAMGLMQIMPAVAQDFEVAIDEAFEPDENIRAGVLLLKRLNKKFHGDLQLTVAAYNAGPGNVDRYNGIPPFKETQNYVKKVLGYHSDLKTAKVQPFSGSPRKLLSAR